MPDVWDQISGKVMREIAEAVRIVKGSPTQSGHRRARYPLAAGVTILRGKWDADVTKGGSGDVSRYDPNDDSDTGTNDTVYAKVADGPSGKWVYYTRMGDHYEAISGECP